MFVVVLVPTDFFFCKNTVSVVVGHIGLEPPVTGAIDCEVPSEHMWVILHQIEIALLTLVKFQRILEAEDCVTGSVVVLAI